MSLQPEGPAGCTASAELQVEVVFCPGRGQVDSRSLQLPAGATLAQAVQASGLLQRYPALGEGAPSCGIWGRSKGGSHVLEDGDRVEVYRPLRIDPKEARRERQRAQRRKPALR